MNGSVDICIGVQLGSEGKGAVVGHLARRYAAAVCTHSSQAGHSVVYNGVKFVNRQLPSSWVNKDAKLYIGPAAMINVEVLFAEMDTIEKAGYDIRNRLIIDYQAGIVEQKHMDYEHAIDTAKTGSTKEGVGAAWQDRVIRRANLAKDIPELQPFLGEIWRELATIQGDILLEGAQGFGLSLFHGDYPFVTSRDMSTGSLLAGAGINPRRLRHVYGVVRTYPIRIAGNSGPLKNELSWEEITKRSGSPTPIQEITTVTKKIRRVGEFDFEQVAKAIEICGIDRLILTFADYLDFHGVYGKNDAAYLTKPVLDFIQSLENKLGVPVCLVGTSPQTMVQLQPLDVH